MDLHERQQFDFLLQVAVERFIERVEQVGQANVRITDFTNAIFGDFLLDNVDGACFVLRALADQSINDSKVETAVVAMAKAVFLDLLRRKVAEGFEQRSTFSAQEAPLHQ